jgi:hypothetical protein
LPQAVAAAPVREHDERTRRAVECRLGILVKFEVCEERHDKASGGAVAEPGRVEDGQRQMPAAVLRIDEFELLHADRGALRERRTGIGQQCAEHAKARDSRSAVHEQEKRPDGSSHMTIVHAPVLSSIAPHGKGRHSDPAHFLVSRNPGGLRGDGRPAANLQH